MILCFNCYLKNGTAGKKNKKKKTTAWFLVDQNLGSVSFCNGFIKWFHMLTKAAFIKF